MSGPKIDKATLERLKKEELERKRQERLAKIKEATQELNSAYSAIRDCMSKVESEFNKAMDSVRGYKENDGLADNIENLRGFYDNYVKSMKSILSQSVLTEADAIRKQASDAQRDGEAAYSSYIKCAQPLFDRISHFLSDKRTAEAALAQNFELREQQDEKYVWNFDFRKYVDEIKGKFVDKESEIDELISKIKALVNNDYVSNEDKGRLFSLANTLQTNATSFEAFMTQFNTIVSEIKQNAEAFREAYEEYCAEYVCFMELINKSLTDESKFDIFPKKPHKFSNFTALRKEREAIKELSISTNEKNYIRSQIDEVMKEVGYNITDELIFRPEQVGYHLVSKSQNSDTAIHIYMSENNQIMMEVASMSEQAQAEKTRANGKISDYTEIPDEERENLLAEQVCFCKLHPQIVEKLRDRGICLDEQERNEPNIEYSTKIIKYIDVDDSIQKDQYIIGSTIINLSVDDEYADGRIIDHYQEREIQ